MFTVPMFFSSHSALHGLESTDDSHYLLLPVVRYEIHPFMQSIKFTSNIGPSSLLGLDGQSPEECADME